MCYARYAAKYAKFLTYACFPQRFITELHLVNSKKGNCSEYQLHLCQFRGQLGKGLQDAEGDLRGDDAESIPPTIIPL